MILISIIIILFLLFFGFYLFKKKQRRDLASLHDEFRKASKYSEIEKIQIRLKAPNDPEINLEKDNEWELHLNRLTIYRKSKWRNKVYFMGDKGGVYTINPNGKKNYNLKKNLL
tara:strand:+ start:5351 stop:5692 length:342 start_codon:yes stop_codon:yes gene_type:complete